MTKARILPLLAGLAFLGLAASFAYKRNYLVAGIFAFGAIMFLRQLLPR